MIIRKIMLILCVLLMVVIATGARSAFASTNVVAVSALSDTRRSITPNDLKPSQCAALNLTNLVVGSGSFNGTTQNDLILGSAGVDTINGGNGDDCILGGGSLDILSGGAGTDVCIGGSGFDIMDATCETAIQ